MSERDDMLRVPAGLDSVGAEHWHNVTPTLWEWGLLTPDARADIEWLVRLHSRFVVLSSRVREQRQDIGTNADALELARVSTLLLWLSHRYGLTPEARAAMGERGRPWTPNPIPERMLCACEGGGE